MTALFELSLRDMLTGLKQRNFSCRELMTSIFEHIEQLEPSLHAFLHIDSKYALDQADRIDRLDQEERPSLLGVPIAVKDVLAVEGMPATAGSKILENFFPPYTATAVARLQEAGAIVVGKTNTDEFAMGSSTENSAFGMTYNPWDISRVPGGSSGGSAAAVAARLVPIALGTDTGGSVRQPASFCGLTGLKPTYGRVSRYGLIAFGSSLDCVGVLARDASDAATLYEYISGYDPLDATCADVPVPAVTFDTHSLQGIKIGIPKEYFISGMQAEVQEKTRSAIAQFESIGAELHEIRLPHTTYALDVYYILAPAEASANLARYDGIRFGSRSDSASLESLYVETRGEKFGPEVTRRIMLGTYALSAGYYEAYYEQAQKVRTLISQDFESAFEQVDLIACPSTPTTAFSIGAHVDDPLAMYLEDIFTLPASLAGIPGVSFPVGFDSAGLPVGMQLLGKSLQEDRLLRAVHSYQQATDWHHNKPMI